VNFLAGSRFGRLARSLLMIFSENNVVYLGAGAHKAAQICAALCLPEGKLTAAYFPRSLRSCRRVCKSAQPFLLTKLDSKIRLFFLRFDKRLVVETRPLIIFLGSDGTLFHIQRWMIIFMAGRTSMRILLLVILILLVLGALPTWPYSADWGYYPSSGLGLVLVVLLVLVLMGRV
jgi:uncharacterized protein DUF3309